MLSKKKQINLKGGSNGTGDLQRCPPSAHNVSSPTTNGGLSGQSSKSTKRISGSAKAGSDLGPSTSSTSVAQLEKGISNVKVNGTQSGRASAAAAPGKTATTNVPQLQVLDGMITNIGTMISNENETQRQRELKRLMTSLKDWDSVDDATLVKLMKELLNNMESIDDKFSPLIQQILIGNWVQRSSKVVTQVERFLSELIVLRPVLAVGVIHCFIAKFSPPSTNYTGPVDEISLAEEKVFGICHQNLQRLFASFPMKHENGVKAMGHLYPYMGKSPHIHYCYVHNLLKSIDYLGPVKGQILHVIVHKLVRIDVNIPRQDIQDLLENQSNRSFRLKKEDGGHDIFQMDMEEDSFTGNPYIETLDVCLNMVFEYVESIFKSREETGTEEDLRAEREAEQSALLNSFLQIFETELLPTFGANNVQFLYFYLLSLQPSFLSTFLEFLWKKATSVNSAPVIRIQTMAYLSGILARAQFISIKTVKRWMTKMSEWANAYASQKSKAAHWSSVNVQAHGPFYAVCQTIFYVFAFRNKELISSRKCASFTRALDLGRLVTSELNPLKACEEQIGVTFVEAAHQHQISYCRTVLERNQSATIPTVAQEMVSSRGSGGSESFLSTQQLEAFFPFDPLLLPRCKKWTLGIHKDYEPYYEELKVEKEEPIRGETTEDSIEMELGSYNGSLRSKDFYCNGVIPFKFKSEIRATESDVDLDFID